MQRLYFSAAVKLPRLSGFGTSGLGLDNPRAAGQLLVTDGDAKLEAWAEPMPCAILLFMLFLGAVLYAHPAIGIVADAAGNIFYSDNVHVWRIALDGNRSIAVANVHTHELWLDSAGNLYGEHLWYEGERTNRWGHRVWKRGPAGEIVDFIAARQGFREDYGDFSFVRCTDGWFYWMAREGSATALKRARPGLPAVTFVQLGSMRPGWLGITSTCDLIFADRGVVHRINPLGKVTALHARPLGDIMGVWADQVGNVYAAIPKRRQVVRIARDGAVSTAATSPSPWRPSSGLITPGGDLWLLEFDSANHQRARRYTSIGIR